MMFKHILCITISVLCLLLTVSATDHPKYKRTQSSVICTGNSCSTQRPGVANNVEPSKKLNKFTYGKAQTGNFMQRQYHQLKRIGYLADGKRHSLFGSTDLVDKAKARQQKLKVNELKQSANQLKVNYKQQRGNENATRLGRSTTFATGSSGMIFSPNRD